MNDSYEIREDDDGTWSVFHIGMGLPIAIDGVAMTCLSLTLAEHVATELNEIEDAVSARAGGVPMALAYH